MDASRFSCFCLYCPLSYEEKHGERDGCEMVRFFVDFYMSIFCVGCSDYNDDYEFLPIQTKAGVPPFPLRST